MNFPRTVHSIGALCLTLAAAACGSPAPEIRQFVAEPERLPRNGGEVVLTWKVSGADTVDIDNLGTGLPNLGFKSTHLTTSTDFLLVARRDGNEVARRTLHVPVWPEGETAPLINVRGRVVDFKYAMPVSGVVVRVADQSATTDADGRFALDTVVGPYDLLVQDRGATVLYRGVSTEKPTLGFGYADFGRAPTAAVPVHAHAEAPNLPSPAFNELFVLSANARGDGQVNWDSAFSGGGTLRFPMFEPAPVDVDVIALRYAYEGNGHDTYQLGHAEVRDLSTNKDNPAPEIAMRVAPTRKIAFDVHLKGAARPVAVIVVAQTPSGGQFDLTLPFRATGRVEVDVPDVPWLRYFVEAFDTGTTPVWAEVQLSEERIMREGAHIPVPPRLTPANGGEIAADEPLRWTMEGPAVCQVDLTAENPGGQPESTSVVTDRAELNPKDVGFRLVSGKNYSWRLNCFPSLTSIDAALESGAYVAHQRNRGEHIRTDNDSLDWPRFHVR